MDELKKFKIPEDWVSRRKYTELPIVKLNLRGFLELVDEDDTEKVKPIEKAKTTETKTNDTTESTKTKAVATKNNENKS